MEAGTAGGVDKVKVANPFPPTPVTVVDNSQPTPLTVVDNSQPTPVTFVDNSQPTPPTVVDNSQPTPVTFVDNPQPTPLTVADNSSPSPVIFVSNSPPPYDPAASTANQTPPQKIAVRVSANGNNATRKAVQIAIGITDLDSVDLSISLDFSGVKIDSTTADDNTMIPIGGPSINPGGGGPTGRISSGGGAETHVSK